MNRKKYLIFSIGIIILSVVIEVIGGIVDNKGMIMLFKLVSNIILVIITYQRVKDQKGIAFRQFLIPFYVLFVKELPKELHCEVTKQNMGLKWQQFLYLY